MASLTLSRKTPKIRRDFTWKAEADRSYRILAAFVTEAPWQPIFSIAFTESILIERMKFFPMEVTLRIPGAWGKADFVLMTKRLTKIISPYRKIFISATKT